MNTIKPIELTNRLYFIDAVRAFAILMMLQGHFIDTLLNPIYKVNSSTAYNVWSYFRGITAPTFFTISGLVFMYLLLRAKVKGNDKQRIKKGLLRGLLLIGIGYSLRINIKDWLFGHFNTYFLVIDVLQCIGLALILLICIYILFGRYSYLLSTILFCVGCICFLSEPLYRNLNIKNMPLAIANYLTTANGSVFTILPWFGYSAFGAFLATVFFRHVHRNKFKIFTILFFLLIGWFLIKYSTWFLFNVYKLTNFELIYQCADYNYLFIRLGNVLVLFGVFYTFEKYLKHATIVRIGEKTLSMYVIHFIILYGSYTGFGLKRFFNQSLTPTEAILGALLFVLTVCFISFYYARTNHFVYKLARKLISKKDKKQ